MFNSIYCETLENRRHLSTTALQFIISGGYDGTSTNGDATATFQDNDDGTVTVNLSNLPRHKMYRTTQLEWPNPDPEQPPNEGEEGRSSGDGAANAQDENGGGDTGGPGGQGDPTETSRWIASSSSSLTILISIGQQGGGGIGLWIALWQPTVSVSGGGTASEGSETPLVFSVSRDAPINYGYSTPEGSDDPIPTTSVNSTAGGSASTEDYTGTLPASVDLTNQQGSKTFSVFAKADSEFDEDDETVTWTATGGQDYETTAAPGNTAIGTIQNAGVTLEYTNPNADGAASDARLPVTAGGSTVTFNGILVKSGGQPAAGVNLNATAIGVPGITATATSVGNGRFTVAITVAATVTPGDRYSVAVKCAQIPDSPTIWIYLEVD